MEEHEAIARLKRGDISGLEVLVRRYQVQAVRAATLITRDRALAEDIVQAAFLRAYERISQFDSGRPFGPWFLRSVVNDAVKAAAQRERQISLEAELDDEASWVESLADPAPGPVELAEAAETSQAVRVALESLPPTQRAAIVLRYYLGLNEAELADTLACPTGTVKWRLHAARERLRALLRPLWDDSP
ncbi:MAG: sigma-70 family RNA polymerase sigma factor [Anaerolineae bacterium]|nr:sigma-70 family RNA polymerase sigma factor [Anaerolineae bacterium]MDW8098675.1 sigma-70 family RNA polymerase sigma factor [Anaerolineae bacterium]